MLVIENSVAGLNKDVKIDYLKNKWSLLDKTYNLNYLLQLENIDKIKNINKLYSKMLDNLNYNNSDLFYILGKNRIKDNLKTIKNKINDFKSRFNLKYEDIFNIRQDLITKITCSYINDSEYIIPEYDNYSSVTGRTKIISGHNFLVMKKTDRSKINSRYVGGRIYEIDIISLEPRIACKIIRDEEYGDLYTHLSKNILAGKHDRKNVKLGLISTLYGAKSDTVKKLSGLGKSSVDKIRDWFDVDNLSNSLNNHYNEHNKITNFYGRNIYSPHAHINHYIQSSSVDSAMIGFNNFIDSQPNGVDLVAIIHDAIILDVHPDNFTNIENTYYVNDHIMKLRLPVKVERIS